MAIVRLISGWLIAPALLISAVGNSEAAVKTTFLWADVAVDPNGRVTEVDVPGRMPDVVEAALKNAIRGWDFEPGKIGDQPAVSTTSVWVSMESTDGDGGLHIYFRKLGEGPRPIRKVRPTYEEHALKAVAEGYTLVEFTVDGRGRVKQPRIVEAEPDDRFVKATLSAIRQWRYKPRTVAGEPIPTRIRQRFRFRGDEGG